MDSNYIVAIVAGLSAAGKSTLCQWAQADLKLLHLEADQADGGGIDHHVLQSEWDAFYIRDDAAPLAQALRRRAAASGMAGTLLSLPGTAWLKASHLNAASTAGLRTVIVTGAPEFCLAAFLAREAASGRGLDEAYWHRNNDHIARIYSAPDYSRFLLEAFLPTGVRVPRSRLMHLLHGAVAA